jgi:hypothetical protein
LLPKREVGIKFLMGSYIPLRSHFQVGLFVITEMETGKKLNCKNVKTFLLDNNVQYHDHDIE